MRAATRYGLRVIRSLLRWTWLLAAGFGLLATGCNSGSAQRGAAAPPEDKTTDIAIGSNAIQSEVKRLGINLGSQNFYDSGQMMRNLVYINPGFEGETWQSILRCRVLTATTCTDGNQWTQWPAGFLDGATFEFISGPARGTSGTVTASDAADSHVAGQGVTIRFAPLRATAQTGPQPGDFLVVKKFIAGNAQIGWWTGGSDGERFSTEFNDLSSHSPGRQALKITALGPGQWASVSSYFDSRAGHSFVQLRGTYRLTFRAKGLAGNNHLKVTLQRQTEMHPEWLFQTDVLLTNAWHDYSFDFPAFESGNALGTVALAFTAVGANLLLDDVSLTQVAESRSAVPNPTAFRDEVLQTLRELHPGILRYQDGDHLGSSIDNLIAPAMARVRAGFSERASQQEMIPVGLPEFLQLCQTVGAEPWFTMPAGMSAVEIQHLIEFLAGPAATPYGAKRTASGQKTPWTTVFPVIHLELGNEEWNGAIFPGSAMPDPVAYGQHAQDIFDAARRSPAYMTAKFDLVIGTFAANPDWTRQELAHSGGYDSTAAAPYLFNTFGDARSKEAIFGPMLAQPEMVDSLPSGYMAQQAGVARSAARAATLSVYEVNVSADSGTVPQAAVDQAIPSLGAGLAVVDHMLLMMRDLGVKTQSIWALPGYDNAFNNTTNPGTERSRLFGVVVDMGGPTNRRRPQYLAGQLANEAILPTMLQTQLTGANPVWRQPRSLNDNIQIDRAHVLQTFAFTDGTRHSLIVFNLSRTETLPLTFSGAAAPAGSVKISQLTAKDIADNNEEKEKVVVQEFTLDNFQLRAKYSVPPYSMTVFRWVAGR